MRLSDNALLQIAVAIRPFITPFIERQGQLTRENIMALAKQHSGHQISSERSVRMVDNFLCEV